MEADNPAYIRHCEDETFYTEPSNIPEPTQAMPGTPEKISVLRFRWVMRQRLFNPLDAHEEEE